MKNSIAPFILLATYVAAASTTNGKQPVGAAIVLANDPSGMNTLAISTMEESGKLTFLKTISTGGRGLRTTATGPDGTFAQGIVKVRDRWLYVANPGSGTVSMFKVDLDSSEKVKMIGAPVSTQGEFPVSLAVSKTTNQVCVLNGGAVSVVSCYMPDDELGLIPVPDTIRNLRLNLTTPIRSHEGSASQVIFTDDGTKLIASVKGKSKGSPGFLATFEVSCSDGSLSEKFVKTGPKKDGTYFMPASLTTITDQKYILNTDMSGAFSIYDFGSGSTPQPKYVGLKNNKRVSRSAFSKRTKNVYLTDAKSNTITEVSIENGGSGKVVKTHKAKKGAKPTDLAVGSLEKQDYLYTLSPGLGAIEVLALEDSGKVKSVQTFNVTEELKRRNVKFTNDGLIGMTLYVRKK